MTQPGIDLFDDPPWSAESEDLDAAAAQDGAFAAIASTLSIAVVVALVMAALFFVFLLGPLFRLHIL